MCAAPDPTVLLWVPHPADPIQDASGWPACWGIAETLGPSSKWPKTCAEHPPELEAAAVHTHWAKHNNRPWHRLG